MTRSARFLTLRLCVLASLRLCVFLLQSHQSCFLEIPEILEHRLGSDHTEVMIPRLSRLRGDEPVDVEPAALAVDRAGNLRPHVPVQAGDSRHLAAAGEEFPGTRRQSGAERGELRFRSGQHPARSEEHTSELQSLAYV